MARSLDENERRWFAEALLLREASRLKVDATVMLQFLRQGPDAFLISRELLHEPWPATIPPDGEPT